MVIPYQQMAVLLSATASEHLRAEGGQKKGIGLTVWDGCSCGHMYLWVRAVRQNDRACAQTYRYLDFDKCHFFLKNLHFLNVNKRFILLTPCQSCARWWMKSWKLTAVLNSVNNEEKQETD